MTDELTHEPSWGGPLRDDELFDRLLVASRMKGEPPIIALKQAVTTLNIRNIMRDAGCFDQHGDFHYADFKDLFEMDKIDIEDGRV